MKRSLDTSRATGQARQSAAPHSLLLGSGFDPKGIQEKSMLGPLFNIQCKARCFDLDLKDDHHQRPLWVFAVSHPPRIIVYLETFSRLHMEATDFLVAVAEPVTRPLHLHEYQVTAASLYTAVSIGMTPDSVIRTLNKLSKVNLSMPIQDFIHKQTASFGKAVLVLRRGRYFIQTRSKEVLCFHPSCMPACRTEVPCCQSKFGSPWYAPELQGPSDQLLRKKF